MLLLIAHNHDAEARWLYHTLNQGARLPVAYLVPEALGIDYKITLRLNNCGPHTASVWFDKPERRLESSGFTYVINRLSYVDPIAWHKAEPSELTYATAELNAFFPALVASLPCKVSNRIHHGSLYGDACFVARWAARMKGRGVPVDLCVLDCTGKSHEKISAATPGGLSRFMYDGDRIFTPHGQPVAPHEAEIRDCLKNSGEDETLEAVFLNESGRTSLIHLSKTPSLSCYGSNYIGSLISPIKTNFYDPTNGHSQRTTLAPAY